MISSNIFVYSSPRETRNKNEFVRKYTVDDHLKTRGYVECIIKSNYSAAIALVIDGDTVLSWRCINLVNNSSEYSCTVCDYEGCEDNIPFKICKSKPGVVCIFNRSDHLSEIRKISNRLDSNCLRFIRGNIEHDFTIIGDYSIVKMAEVILSALSIGTYRSKNYDYLTGVSLDNPNNLSISEINDLIMANVTIRMLFTAYDFSPTS